MHNMFHHFQLIFNVEKLDYGIISNKKTIMLLKLFFCVLAGIMLGMAYEKSRGKSFSLM